MFHEIVFDEIFAPQDDDKRIRISMLKLKTLPKIVTHPLITHNEDSLKECL